MPGREERLATNEAYFREINQRVEERVKKIAGDAATFNILCECARLECTERISGPRRSTRRRTPTHVSSSWP